MTVHRPTVARMVAAALLLAVMPVSAPTASAAPPTPTGDLAPSLDFNGDRRADLAVGVPGEDVQVGTRRVSTGGAVNVIYGSKTGLTASRNQLWSQNSSGVEGTAEYDDRFGSVVAGGDFNGDGRDELVVGVPNEGVGRHGAAGSVHVLYGSATGLTAARDQRWSQDTGGVPGAAERDDRFGQALATGRFNNDKYDDLAVGSPGESTGGERQAGSVTVLFGSPTGLRGSGSILLTQATGGTSALAFEGRFGTALAVGDANRDGYGDLAVGAPGDTLQKGAVLVFRGGRTGISTRRAPQVWTQGANGIPEIAEEGDVFGEELQFGDFDGNGHADLAISAPGERYPTCPAADVFCRTGAVHVLYGRTGGLASAGGALFSKTEGLGGPATERESIGRALASGDFNGDGRWELAISSFFSATPRGRVYVVPGSATGLSASGATSLTVDSPGMPGASVPVASYQFGGSLAVGNYAGGAAHALAIAVEGDQIGFVEGAGRVVVLYGKVGAGLSTTGSQSWSQASTGIRGNPDLYDSFGSLGRY